MTIPCGERFAVQCWLEAGEFCYKRCAIRADFVDDATEAVRLLRTGNVIWLRQDARLVNRVQRAIEGEKHHPR